VDPPHLVLEVDLMVRPQAADEAPDPRLDPYRDRAGVLSLDGVPVGHLLVETDYGVFKAGGALWWTRWAPPVECAVVALLVDGELVDGQTFAGDDLDEQLVAWARGTHVLGSTPYTVTWLDGVESDRVHREVFGHHH
jgi:hypothetical protein